MADTITLTLPNDSTVRGALAEIAARYRQSALYFDALADAFRDEPRGTLMCAHAASCRALADAFASAVAEALTPEPSHV